MLVGILSDTHLQALDESFVKQCTAAFSGCDTIIHAGDLTDATILRAFNGKDIHAVCGNMCNMTTRQILPQQKQIVLGGYTIGISHGTGERHTIEERVLQQFPDVDCIVFGHTHQPVCRRVGDTLLINPGSFAGTGRYGAPGTYVLLTIDESALVPLNASLHTLPDRL